MALLNGGLLARLQAATSILGGALLVHGWSIAAEAITAREYEVKAAFLFNFARFVDWPANSAAVRGPRMVIGVLGTDPFGSIIESVIGASTVKGRQVAILRLQQAADAQHCHIVFIGATDEAQRGAALAALSRYPVLTVGDGAAFIDQGGMIAFQLIDDRVKVAINQRAAARAGLSISSKLLALATRVITDSR